MDTNCSPQRTERAQRVFATKAPRHKGHIHASLIMSYAGQGEHKGILPRMDTNLYYLFIATKRHKRHEDKLDADFADYADLRDKNHNSVFLSKNAQKSTGHL